jgi:hypothetical protein
MLSVSLDCLCPVSCVCPMLSVSLDCLCPVSCVPNIVCVSGLSLSCVLCVPNVVGVSGLSRHRTKTIQRHRQHWAHKTQDKDNPETQTTLGTHKTQDKDNPEVEDFLEIDQSETIIVCGGQVSVHLAKRFLRRRI